MVRAPQRRDAPQREHKRECASRGLRRLIVEVTGLELERALANDAIDAARGAAALRGELVLDDADYSDADLETTRTTVSETRSTLLRRRRRPPAAEEQQPERPPPRDTKVPRYVRLAVATAVVVLAVRVCARVWTGHSAVVDSTADPQEHGRRDP